MPALPYTTPWAAPPLPTFLTRSFTTSSPPPLLFFLDLPLVSNTPGILPSACQVPYLYNILV